jgi:LPXTG-motif cell wall-anchored protein
VPSSVVTLEASTTIASHQTLPFTGSSAWPPLLGLASLAMGGGLLLITRRRNARRA